jgi:hypothetical protein
MYWSEDTRVTTQTLDGVDFVDRKTGWVVGTNGTILHTSNGLTWSPQASGTSAFLRDVDFIDGDTGWAVGNLGTILHTLDGGTTWSVQVSGTLYDLRAVEFINADTGWAVGDDNTILRTLDGGATWIGAEEPGGLPYYSHLRGVAFVNTNRGTAVGIGYTPAIDGVALHTWTGGASWDSRAIPESVHLESVAFVAHSEHWVGGDLCRSQCLLDVTPCEKRPRSDFPDYPEAVQELIAWASNYDCDYWGGAGIEGTCGNGQVLFTRRSDGLHAFTYFHDSATLRFTGLTTASDYVTSPCNAAGYWPDSIACPDATVTAVHCGSFYSLGDPVYMPPDGTLPIEGAFVYPEDVPALPAAAGILVVASLLLTAVARLRRSSRSPLV